MDIGRIVRRLCSYHSVGPLGICIRPFHDKRAHGRPLLLFLYAQSCIATVLLKEMCGERRQDIGGDPPALLKIKPFVFVNDIGDQFLIRFGAIAPF